MPNGLYFLNKSVCRWAGFWYIKPMTTLTVYSPKHHMAYHNADRDVIAHALESERFVSVECDGYWNFYVDGVPTDKASFCALLGKQIADNGSEYTTSDNSDMTMGFRAVAVGCQYYRNTHYKTDANSAGALFAFITNHTDMKEGSYMTKNFELLKRLMLKAKEDAFLTPDTLPEGVYETMLCAISESDKRTVFVFEIPTGGKIGMTFGNDETGLGFLAQTLVRLGVNPDMPTFEGLKGTKVVLNVTHSDSGEYLRARIAAVVGKAAAVSAAAPAAAGRKAAAPVAAVVEEEVVEQAAGSAELDLSSLEAGTLLTVQFGDEQKEGSFVAAGDEADTFVVTVDGDDYAFPASDILGLVEAAPEPEPAPVTRKALPSKKAAPPAAVSTKPAAKAAVSKPAAKPGLKHAAGDKVIVDIGDGKQYRTSIKAIDQGQYLASVKGQDYLLTDDHIVG